MKRTHTSLSILASTPPLGEYAEGGRAPLLASMDVGTYVSVPARVSLACPSSLFI